MSWVRAVLIATLLVQTTITAEAGFRCYVEDPTGTELNVRTSPGGKVVGKISNRQIVSVIERAEYKGKAWVYISDWEDNDRPVGWVFDNYIQCRKTID